MKAPDIWRELGIDLTDDVRAIRRAYAARLKAIDIDADPERYAVLRLARDAALRSAAGGGDDDALPPTPRPADQEMEGERLAVHPFRAPALDGAWPATLAVASARPPEPVAFDVLTGCIALLYASATRARTLTILLPVQASLVPPSIDRETAGAIPAFANPYNQLSEGDHFSAILAILFPNGDRTEELPTPEVEAALLGHFNAVITSPRIGEMGYFADTERWFSDIVAHGAPASNVLMAPSADFFRWRERAGELGEADTVIFINRRLKILEFVETVSAEGHPWYRAWAELTTYAHERSRRGRGVKRQHVRELLEAVRRDCPDAEGYFDGTRVALWENPSDATNLPWSYIFIGGFMLLALLGRCAEFLNEPSGGVIVPPPIMGSPTGSPAEQLSDIDSALRANGYTKLTLAAAERRNPELANTLKSNWALSSDSGPRQGLPERLRTALDERARLAMRNAPYHLLAEYRRIQLKRADLYRRQDLVLCDNLFRRGERRDLPGSAAIDREQAALVEEMLLDATGLLPSRQGDYVIPGAIVADIIDKTGIPSDRVRAAFDGQADAADRCNVQIALIEAILALPPREGLALLRAI